MTHMVCFTPGSTQDVTKSIREIPLRITPGPPSMQIAGDWFTGFFENLDLGDSARSREERAVAKASVGHFLSLYGPPSLPVGKALSVRRWPASLPRRTSARYSLVADLSPGTNNEDRTTADRGAGGGLAAAMRRAGGAIAPNPHPRRAPPRLHPPPPARRMSHDKSTRTDIRRTMISCWADRKPSSSFLDWPPPAFSTFLSPVSLGT